MAKIESWKNKTIGKDCKILDVMLLQIFPYVENGGLNHCELWK